MTKKTRTIILIICVALFLVVSPILIMYSMGYRYDFKNLKITATGGIYIRTFPTADQISIDSAKSQKPGMFSNSVFTQNLLPGDHSVLIKKDGYYDYNKTLPVEEKEVTKLENVLLFKTNILFEVLVDQTKSPFLPENQPEKYTIVANNLYYSDSSENAKLTTLQKNTSLIKNLVAFTTSGNDIIWLSTDGFLYKSDLKAKPEKLNMEALKIIKAGNYKIDIDGSIFVNNNGNLLMLDNQTKILKNFASLVNDFSFSPNKKNIVYSTGKKVYVSLLSDESKKISLLYSSPEIISGLTWVNNDYIIFTSEGKIVISEIDYRGNVNSINLAQNFSKILFNQQESKLYILAGKQVQISEKLTP